MVRAVSVERATVRNCRPHSIAETRIAAAACAPVEVDRAAFAHWKFTNVHFEKIALQPDDFVYADPPYDVEFRQYSKGGFGWEEQEHTAYWLAQHHGPVILSNQATPRIGKLYRQLGCGLRFLQAPRKISCNGDRTPAKEVLAIRNLPQ